jgi:putative membrane protein
MTRRTLASAHASVPRWLGAACAAAAVAVSIAVPLSASAQGPPAGATENPRPPVASLSTDDLRFIDEATLTAAMAIDTARLAAEASESTTVVAYARAVARDYREIGAELTSIAQSKGVQPEKRMPEAPEVSKLRSLKGAEFDRVYSQIVAVDASRLALMLFQKQASQGKDPELRAFARRNLPILQQHAEVGSAMGTRTIVDWAQAGHDFHFSRRRDQQ